VTGFEEEGCGPAGAWANIKAEPAKPAEHIKTAIVRINPNNSCFQLLGRRTLTGPAPLDRGAQPDRRHFQTTSFRLRLPS
jgi:hypothetical protein